MCILKRFLLSTHYIFKLWAWNVGLSIIWRSLKYSCIIGCTFRVCTDALSGIERNLHSNRIWQVEILVLEPNLSILSIHCQQNIYPHENVKFFLADLSMNHVIKVDEYPIASKPFHNFNYHAVDGFSFESSILQYDKWFQWLKWFPISHSQIRFSCI